MEKYPQVRIKKKERNSKPSGWDPLTLVFTKLSWWDSIFLLCCKPGCLPQRQLRLIGGEMVDQPVSWLGDDSQVFLFLRSTLSSCSASISPSSGNGTLSSSGTLSSRFFCSINHLLSVGMGM